MRRTRTRTLLALTGALALLLSAVDARGQGGGSYWTKVARADKGRGRSGKAAPLDALGDLSLALGADPGAPGRAPNARPTAPRPGAGAAPATASEGAPAPGGPEESAPRKAPPANAPEGGRQDKSPPSGGIGEPPARGGGPGGAAAKAALPGEPRGEEAAGETAAGDERDGPEAGAQVGPEARTPVGPEASGAQRFLPASDRFRGKRVDIVAGDIPVKDFLAFLADYTGLPVILDSSQTTAGLANLITIAADIKDADGEMVKAILEANRWLITQETLANGKDVLHIRFLGAPQAPQEAPREKKLIRMGEDSADVIPSQLMRLKIQPDEIVTMLFTLKYTEPADAIAALSSLISQGTVRTTGAAGPRNQAFSVVDIKNTMMLIVTAKFSLVDYIQKLLSIIDVEVKEPERIVHIIEVEEADASELVSIIESFLQQRATRRTRTSRTTTARPAGTTARPTPPVTSRGRTGFGQDEYETTLIADPRTQKIIVTTYSPRDFEDISMLVRELDTRFDLRRLKTQIYRMKYLKAVDVAPVIQELLGSGGGLRRTGQRGLGGRDRGTSRGRGAGTTAQPATRAARPTGAAGGQGVVPSLIVPHEETNSLVVQAEPEDWQEILNILEKIDVKRRQVFLEAALVQVNTSSTLNYTIELLAGEPDDQSTRVLFESSFGLTGIDTENFDRVFDLTQPPSGAVLAIMNRGKFPALISALKTNTDSEVLATPFILADDNIENEINITETRYVVQSSTVNQVTTTSQQSEEAGIRLNLIATISSENAVLLDVQLEVSEFGQATTQDTFPPKTSNTITSAVTISDDRIYVVGGLTRQRRDKAVSKVPLVGDIPLLGKLFRSEANAKAMTNLYIFLRAHILTHPDFGDVREISRIAEAQLRARHPDIEISQFEEFERTAPPEEKVDPDDPVRIRTRKPGDGQSRLEKRYQGDPESPFEALPPVEGRDEEGENGRVEIGETPLPIDDTTRPPPISEDRVEEEDRGRAGETVPVPERKGPAPWEKRGLEIDPKGESWFLPLKRKETAKARSLRRQPRGRQRDKVSAAWLGGW